MAQKIMRKEFIYKAVSLLIAVILWFFVAYAENPEKELWFKDIPITFAGEGALAEDGFTRVVTDADKVSVKVKGSRSAIVALSSADIIATVDLSLVKEAKLYTLPVAVKFPVDGLTLSDKKPYSVTVKIEEIITKEVPVKVEMKGASKEGVEIAQCTPAEEKVKISGGKSAVESVEYALIRPDISEVSGDKKVNCLVEVKKKDGEVGKYDTIKLSKAYMDADIKVNITKEVPVKAVISDQWKDKVKSVNLQSAAIEISGSFEVAKDIKEIETEVINISGKAESEKIVADLKIPDGVTASNSTVTAEVIIAKEDIINE